MLRMERQPANRFKPKLLVKDWVCVMDGSVTQFISLKYQKHQNKLVAVNVDTKAVEWTMIIPSEARTIVFADSSQRNRGNNNRNTRSNESNDNSSSNESNSENRSGSVKTEHNETSMNSQMNE